MRCSEPLRPSRPVLPPPPFRPPCTGRASLRPSLSLGSLGITASEHFRNIAVKLAMKTIWAFLLAILPQICFCSEEMILEPAEVNIRADAGASFGEVIVTIRTKGLDSARRISDIKLQVGSKPVRIPERAYSDLELPLLNTVELRTEPGYDKEPLLYIFFQTGYRTSDRQWRPKRVHIAYHAGRVESRSIETPNPDGSYTWNQDKL